MASGEHADRRDRVIRERDAHRKTTVGWNYLKWYETFARVQAPFRHKAIDGKAENPEMERIHRMIDTALNKVHHNLRSQYRFSVLLMAHDAKRYTEEIARHLRV